MTQQTRYDAFGPNGRHHGKLGGTAKGPINPSSAVFDYNLKGQLVAKTTEKNRRSLGQKTTTVWTAHDGYNSNGRLVLTHERGNRSG